MEGVREEDHEDPKLVQGDVDHSCSRQLCFFARCFFTQGGTVRESLSVINTSKTQGFSWDVGWGWDQ